MRYIFIGLLAAVGIGVVWLFTARSVSLLVDRMHTITLEALSPDGFLFDGRELEFGPYSLSLMTLDYKYSADANISANGRASLTDLGKSFAFGPGRPLPSKTGFPKFEFTPDAGDTVRFTRERSLLFWPVFQMNFMTGSAPSARRHVYCRLIWKKRIRAKLEMLWRAEQAYYSDGGWRPEKVEAMTSNLLSVKITEAAP